MTTASISLANGETKTITLQSGLVEFKVKLIDVSNIDVEIHKCVQMKCEFHDLAFADSYGIIVFRDIISGLSTIQYRFVIKNNVFGKLNVIPQVIDIDSIIQRTASLIERIITSVITVKVIT